MELYEQSKPSFAIDRRLKQLYEYNNDETWQDRGQDFPLVLCVCESPTQVKNLPKQIRRADYKHNMGDDISFYVTTLDQLQNISIDNKAIWQNVDDLDEIVGLEDAQIE